MVWDRTDGQNEQAEDDDEDEDALPGGEEGDDYVPTADVQKETKDNVKVDGPAAAVKDKKDATTGEKRKAEDEGDKEGKGDKEAKTGVQKAVEAEKKNDAEVEAVA